MLKEILKNEEQSLVSYEGDETIQKIWDEFDKCFMNFKKNLRKAGIPKGIMMEIDDAGYKIYDLLGVK